MWDVHFISDERNIHKCLCLGTWLIGMFCSNILGFDLILLFDKISRSVFDGLKSMFHLHAQSFKFVRSEFISFSKIFRFLNLSIRATSSAIWFDFFLDERNSPQFFAWWPGQKELQKNLQYRPIRYSDLYCTKYDNFSPKCIKIAGGWASAAEASAPDPAEGSYKTASPAQISLFVIGER